MRLTTNQKIAGSSSARINNKVLSGKDLDRLVWQAYVAQLKVNFVYCTSEYS
jgi:hypothetical protein